MSNSYDYDALGRLTQVNGSAVTAAYTYDANSNPLTVSYNNGVTQNYSYNAGNMVTQTAAKKGASTLAQYQYTYDLAGRQTSVTDHTGRTASYTYDKLGQLTAESITGSVGSSKTYTYDPSGNRVSLSEGGAVTASTYNAANQLIQSTSANDETTNYYVMGKR